MPVSSSVLTVTVVLVLAVLLSRCGARLRPLPAGYIAARFAPTSCPGLPPFASAALQKFGYVIFERGRIVAHLKGTDFPSDSPYPKMWAGGDPSALIEAFSFETRADPRRLMIFKADSSRDLRVADKLEIASEGIVVFACCTPREETFVRRLPTAWCSEYRAQLSFHGLCAYPWASRKPLAVWRGMTSGVYRQGEAHHRRDLCGGLQACGPRLNLVRALVDDPNCDVGFSSSHLPAQVLDAAPLLKGRLSEAEQSGYRAVLVVDGWGFPGNLRWALESGSIVLLCSELHLGVVEYLRHGVHCFLLSPDGSDARQVVRHALALDASDAEAMVGRARSLAHSYFEPAALRRELRRALAR